MSANDHPTCGDWADPNTRCQLPAEWAVWTPAGLPAFRCDGHRMPLGRNGSEHLSRNS